MYAFVFTSLVRLCLRPKLPSFLTTGYTGKHQPVVTDFQAIENTALAV